MWINLTIYQAFIINDQGVDVSARARARECVYCVNCELRADVNQLTVDNEHAETMLLHWDLLVLVRTIKELKRMKRNEK